MPISYSKIIKSAQSAFYVITASGEIVKASRGLYAVPEDVFIERGIDAFDLFLAEHERLPFAQMLSIVLEGRGEVVGRIFQTNTYNQNGEPAFFSITSQIIPGYENHYLLEAADHTTLVREERELRRLQRETSIFKKISYLRQIHTDSEEFFMYAVQSIIEATDSDAALLYVQVDSHEELLVQNGVSQPGNGVPAYFIRLPHALQKMIHPVLFRADTTYCHRTVAPYVAKGWNTQLIVPLTLRDERVGTLVLLSQQDDAFPWYVVRLASSTASYLGAFLATELLWRQKEHLSALTQSAFAHSSDGLFVIDRNGLVRERNTLAEKIMDSNDNTGLAQLVVARHRLRVKDFITGLSANQIMRVSVVFAADPTQTFEISATPLVTGELVHYLCVARNVTGWVDERFALKQRNEQLSMIDRMKDEFVSMVSHELRSPLTVLMGNLSLLEKHSDVNQKPYINDMRRNVDRLNRLIRDILEVTRLEYADITFDSTQVELLAIAEVVSAAVEQEVAAKKLQWKVECGSATVKNDPVRLAQIITNLATNAVRHTNDGGSVTVKMEVDDDWLTVTVRDTGEGMTPEQQKHIFERFYRGRHNLVGFGLGLYIVKKLLERMHGKIIVKSAVGKGTTITVCIPRVI